MAHNYTKHCEKCTLDFRVNVFVRHFTSCKGPKLPPKIRGVDFDPNAGYKNGTRLAWNKGLSKETNDSLKSSSETLKAKFASGEIPKTGYCSLEYPREKLVEHGRKGGGYRERAGRSKKFYVLDSFGNNTCLQSSHELTVAQALDERNIKWKREGCFRYDAKRYFPDFHLVESDVYLDVKNEYLIKVDAEKIRKVREQNPTIDLRVFTLKQLDETIGR
jgi:hypothetical protein